MRTKKTPKKAVKKPTAAAKKVATGGGGLTKAPNISESLLPHDTTIGSLEIGHLNPLTELQPTFTLAELKKQVQQLLAAMKPTAAEDTVFRRYASRVAQAALPAVKDITVEALTRLAIQVSPNLDPRLQVAVARHDAGLPPAAAASAVGDEIPVLAKVNNLTAWEELSEVRIGTTVNESSDNEALVTARIPVSRIEHVRSQPFVLSLKASQVLRPALKETIVDTGCQTTDYPAGTQPAGGKGVLIGIVDYGCDFLHKNFRHADGTSRIEVIWHQSGTRPSSQNLPSYGRLYTKKEINEALEQSNPYAALGYAPYIPRLPDEGAHGTHVMDIAAGNGLGTGQPGCAPEADIAFVDIAGDDYYDTHEDIVRKSFGDSVQLAEAVQFLFERAGDRPCVVNISLGTNGGPHDGTTLVEQWLDRLVRAKPNRAVVISGSNSYGDGIHAAGNVSAKKHFDLTWDMKRGRLDREIEIWHPGAAQLAVELISPDNKSLGIVEAGANLTLGQTNQIAIFISNRLTEPNNNDNVIGVFVAAGVPGGNWTVRLHSRTNKDTSFHAWIEREDGEQTRFPPPNDNSHTIGSVSCGHESIVVGSFDAHKASRPLSWFSSEGPTRDGREKPEVSAPGHAVVAALSRSINGVTSKSGTSMAAPAVTGLVALMLAEAARKGKKMSSAEIRKALIASTRRNPPAGTKWHSRYGAGRVYVNAIK